MSEIMIRRHMTKSDVRNEIGLKRLMERATDLSRVSLDLLRFTSGLNRRRPSL